MMGELPRVTVGIPFQTEPPTILAEAITSVMLQSLTAWRLILVGDGAGPEQVRVARAAAAADSRILLIAHEERMGLARRLNEMTARSETPLVARMDADDVMRKTRLERQVEAFDLDPWLDVCGSRAIVINEDDGVEGFLREQVDVPAKPIERVHSNLLTHPSVMARQSWMQEHAYSCQYPRAEDKELWLRTIDKSVFRKLQEPLLFYRVPRELSRRKSIRTVLDGLSAGEEYATQHLTGPQRLKEYMMAGVRVVGYGLATRRTLHSIRGMRIETCEGLLSAVSEELVEIQMRAELLIEEAASR